MPSPVAVSWLTDPTDMSLAERKRRNKKYDFLMKPRHEAKRRMLIGLIAN